MNLLITDLLDLHQIEALAESLADADAFSYGRQTAGRLAKQVKYNLQLRSGDALTAARSLVSDALLKHPVVRSVARPKSIVRMMANRYETGMGYGIHIDDPLLDGQRCDLSFTLCLSKDTDYDGGALVIDSDDGEQSFHLDQGHLLLYPSCQLHRVETVTRGVRIALVGWIHSWIAAPQQRAVLFDLDRVIETLSTADKSANRLQRCRASLLQMWAV